MKKSLVNLMKKAIDVAGWAAGVICAFTLIALIWADLIPVSTLFGVVVLMAATLFLSFVVFRLIPWVWKNS